MQTFMAAEHSKLPRVTSNLHLTTREWQDDSWVPMHSDAFDNLLVEFLKNGCLNPPWSETHTSSGHVLQKFRAAIFMLHIPTLPNIDPKNLSRDRPLGICTAAGCG